MEDKLFNTEKKQEAGRIAFASLLDHPGWKLFEEITKANIEVVSEIILKGGLPEKTLDAYRKKLEAYKEDLNCPKVHIKKLTSPKEEEPNLDPYPTVEELKEKRKKS